MFRTDRGIVETRRDRVCRRDLAVAVLKNVTPRALENSDIAAADKSCGVPAKLRRGPAGLDPDHLYPPLIQKIMEQSDRIGASTDTSHEHIGKPTLGFHYLQASFTADDALKIAHHQRIRMWSQRRSKQVMRCRDIRHPVAESFVDRVLKRA